jgi:starch-binding outer membrane protein, SusD/RagB family
MRLADVYLIYAEAANEAYGASGSVPGKNYTAIDAINVLRQRAGMPDVSNILYCRRLRVSEIWSATSVSLNYALKVNYWFDISRWYIAHLEEYKFFTILNLIKIGLLQASLENTCFTRVFDDPKHYWMPLPVSKPRFIRNSIRTPVGKHLYYLLFRNYSYEEKLYKNHSS